MNFKNGFVKSGDKVQLSSSGGIKKIFIVEAFTEDELVLCGPETKFSSLTTFPVNEVVFKRSSHIDGWRITKGDKVKLVKQIGEDPINVYISYILNKDSVIVSQKKEPSLTALRWLLKMMNFN